MARISTRRICPLFVFVWLFLFLKPFPAAATTYQWTDEQGSIHFTNDLATIPSSYQGEVKTVPRPEPSPPPPAPPPPPNDDEEVQEENPEVLAYEECTEALEKTREDLQTALAKDRDLLEQLNRGIHRSTTSRHKNKLQRMRVETKARIQSNQEKLDKEIPNMQWECNRKKPSLP
jgi:hypothetical protein